LRPTVLSGWCREVVGFVFGPQRIRAPNKLSWGKRAREWWGRTGRMNESIIVGVVVGVVVAIASGYISHCLRKKEMEALWAEEERRRKSDRRQEVYEKELSIVRDSVYAAIEAMTESLREPRHGLRHKLQAEADTMIVRAVLVETSLDDEELRARLMQLVDHRDTWRDLIDWDTGRPKEGKEEELRKVVVDAHEAASNIFRRIREILEEV